MIYTTCRCCALDLLDHTEKGRRWERATVRTGTDTRALSSGTTDQVYLMLCATMFDVVEPVSLHMCYNFCAVVASPRLVQNSKALMCIWANKLFTTPRSWSINIHTYIRTHVHTYVRTYIRIGIRFQTKTRTRLHCYLRYRCFCTGFSSETSCVDHALKLWLLISLSWKPFFKCNPFRLCVCVCVIEHTKVA